MSTANRRPVSFAEAWRARLVGLLAQGSIDAPGSAPRPITGSDFDLAWRLYQLARRARLNAIESATATASRRVQRGRRMPTFEFSLVSGGESLGDVTYGICRPCSTGTLYQIEFAPDWQFCGFGRLALSQIEARHPDLTWYTTAQFPDPRGFYDRYHQDSASPSIDQQRPCQHFDSQKGDDMTETVYPRGGDPVTLRPCPPWCTESRHFSNEDIVDVDDGFHHYGPEIAIPTSDRMLVDDPETVVKVILKSWTHPLDAEPGPGRVDLALATTEGYTDMYAELTPDEARALAAALLKIADIAEGTDQE